MKIRTLIFALAIVGIGAAIYAAFVSSQRPPAQKPVFTPAANPYKDGIYANGIVESCQTHGSNINIYPEVSGPITTVAVNEGAIVKAGDTLLLIDDSVQRANAEQQKASADAALAMLDELKAQPRPEALQVAVAQVDNARAGVKSAQDHFAKLNQAFQTGSAVTLDDLDTARDAMAAAQSNLIVAQRQLDLTKAGAWSYDIRNQQALYDSLSKAYASSKALLDKYTVRSPIDGIVLSIETSAGSYISPTGAYGTYTQGFSPVIIMGSKQDDLEVRCYVDEILVHRLPEPSKMSGTMYIQGTDIKVPLEFERLQPYVSPKIELADQRQERVDVRVLPVIFRFHKPPTLQIYPGQLVDVYIGQK